MAAPFPSPTTKWHSTTYNSLSPLRPELSAAGKTILITGGGTGIGAETARYFAQAGASRIALIGRREQPLLDTKTSIEQKYPNVTVFTASVDIYVKEQVNAAFDTFVKEGRIDVLVSNAAMVGPKESVQDAEGEEFLEAIHLSVKGALYIAQAFLRHAAKDAVVIDVNSNASHVNFTPVFASYSIAKWAVFKLWDSVGAAKPELSVFHIQPGVVDTAMNKEAGGIEALGFSDDVSLPASFNVWLASPEAEFLKGKFLWANWDVDELKARAEDIVANREFNIELVGWPFGHPSSQPIALGNWDLTQK